MHHGFVPVAAATPALRVADCAYNVSQIIAMRRTAVEHQVSLLLLPSLCLTGATCGDLFYQYTLLDAAVGALLSVCADSAEDDLLTFVGLPLPLDGKIYHCMAAIHRGAILGIVPQRRPVDNRYFAPAPAAPTTLTLEGYAVPFGADLLFTCANVPSLTVGIAFTSCETQQLSERGATLILYPSAKPSIVGQYVKQRSFWMSQSAIHHTAALHAGAGLGESAMEGTFAGHGLVIENGRLLAEAPRFSTSLAVSEIDLERMENERRRDTNFISQSSDQSRCSFSLTKRTVTLTRHVPHLPFVPEYAPDWASHCEEAFLLAAHALAGRVRHVGCDCVVLGLSGGLDSTLAALTCANAMSLMERPTSDVLAVCMPGFATGARTSGNARIVAAQLGFTVREIDIRPSVVQHLEDINHKNRDDVAFENAQARERTQILLDLANAHKGIVVGTGDLSELALGFCTYGGDSLSHFGVNADIPKTFARAMVQYAAEVSDNEALNEALLDVVETPISPELLPGPTVQATEDILGPYELHDFYLYYTIRWGFPPDKILRLAVQAFGEKYDMDTLQNVLTKFYTRFFANHFKRICSPDIAHLGSVSLSPGRYRAPSEALARSWMQALQQSN